MSPVTLCYLCDKPVDGHRVPPGSAPLCRHCLYDELGFDDERTDPGLGRIVGNDDFELIG